MGLTGQRMTLAAGAVVLVTVLAGCGSSGGSTSTAGAASSSSTPPAQSAGSSAPAPAPSSTAPPTSAAPVPRAGCPRTSLTVPAGAVTKPTVDVDGDGRPDTEWIVRPDDGTDSYQFGVATASGGVFSASATSPNGAGRSFLVADVTGHGEVIGLASDNRQAGLYGISDCQLVPELNPQGQHYGFDLGGDESNGVGCTDVDGDGVPDLAGLLIVGQTVQQTAVRLDGPHARNGARRTIDPASAAQRDAARQITCGDRTTKDDGVLAP
jgi:hypothetical protein